MYPAPSDARKHTTSDISLVIQYRLRGMRTLNSSFSGKLSINPGRILFILILSAAYLSAYNFVKDASPALKTPDVGNIDSGSNVAKVDMLIITPYFCFYIKGVTNLVECTTFMKYVSIPLCQSSSVNSSIGPLGP